MDLGLEGTHALVTGSTEGVGSLVTYPCSEAVSATTGSSIRVDGAVVRSIA